MGVDFLICNLCARTFPDCGDYVRCGEECWNKWCSEECAKKEGWVRDREREDEGDGDDLARTCKYCRNEDVDDTVLLKFLMKKCKTTRKKLLKELLAKTKA